MRCDHSECTGNHDRNRWDNLCPRSKEAGNQRDRRRYAAQPWLFHHERQMKNRRLRALQRMSERLPKEA